MGRNDIRAVENPISAVFDLAEEVSAEVPRIRKLVTYATVFIGIWLFVDLILILASVGNGNVFLAFALLALFVIGILALAMLRNLGDFMRYYSGRHEAILRVRNEDPIVYVPKGDTAVIRLFQFLGAKSQSLGPVIASRQYQLGAILKGESGLLYNFDGYLRSDPGSLWRSLGLGYPGYQLIIKAFGYPPRPEDLVSLKNAAEDVSKDNKLPPSRVIALWIRRADQDLSEEAYRTISDSRVAFAHRGKKYASSLELIIENEDGTYEFIPYMAA
ncbi:MAG: hypothetical protein LUO79_01870 [Methanomassiliicoccales archaeon]|nr:hypothetical protein [Methanomassiliicoccales archaeon]